MRERTRCLFLSPSRMYRVRERTRCLFLSPSRMYRVRERTRCLFLSHTRERDISFSFSQERDISFSLSLCTCERERGRDISFSLSRSLLHVQLIAFGVSFNLNLQFQSPWSLFIRMWQKRPIELDYRLRLEIEEMTLQMQ